MPARKSERSEPVILVFPGGVGLGAYQAGVSEALLSETSLRPSWFCASSVGAINTALIAGTAPDAAMDSIRRFWAIDPPARLPSNPVRLNTGARNALNWMSALGTRLVGAPGFFHPRLLASPFERFASLYDLSPTRAKIEALVDFERLNGGEIRVTIATTDIESGECVLFDTARGDRIGLDHLLASCGFLPEFAPVEIDGRLLGDGGLSANAPIEPIFQEELDDARIVFIADLFSRQGGRPATLLEALARKNDLLFGNQTLTRLEAYQRLRAAADAAPRSVYYLCYRAPRYEAGPEKEFDFSPQTIAERWQSGRLDMLEALRHARNRRAPRPEVTMIRRT
jgi:NTE family protein